MSGLSKKEKDQLRALGIDPDLIKAKDAENTTAAKEMNSLAADFTLKSLRVIPTEQARKNCGECGRSFLTSYLSVGYCSDTCRATGLEYYGMDWTNKNARERWGKDGYYEPPGIIPPDALNSMKRLLELAGYEIKPPLEIIPEIKNQKEDRQIEEEIELSPAKVSLEYLKSVGQTHEEHSTIQTLNESPQGNPQSPVIKFDALFGF